MTTVKERIEVKELKIGDKFKMNMISPKGYLILKVESIESSYPHTPWCLVYDHFYRDPAEDDFEEDDRWKTGDLMPYVYTSDVELVK